MLHAFGDCVVDPSCFELRRRGKAVRLEPKVFDVLLYLMAHRDRVVTKQELLDALWPGEAVGDSVLPRCIAAMRRVVGDTRSRQRVIATAYGRGDNLPACFMAFSMWTLSGFRLGAEEHRSLRERIAASAS